MLISILFWEATSWSVIMITVTWWWNETVLSKVVKSTHSHSKLVPRVVCSPRHEHLTVFYISPAGDENRTEDPRDLSDNWSGPSKMGCFYYRSWNLAGSLQGKLRKSLFVGCCVTNSENISWNILRHKGFCVKHVAFFQLTYMLTQSHTHTHIHRIGTK